MTCSRRACDDGPDGKTEELDPDDQIGKTEELDPDDPIGKTAEELDPDDPIGKTAEELDPDDSDDGWRCGPAPTRPRYRSRGCLTPNGRRYRPDTLSMSVDSDA